MTLRMKTGKLKILHGVFCVIYFFLYTKLLENKILQASKF